MSALLDLPDIALRILLEAHNMKFLSRIKFIDQKMRNTLHFFRCHLCGTDIHSPVDLHGICGNDFPADFLCKRHR